MPRWAWHPGAAAAPDCPTPCPTLLRHACSVVKSDDVAFELADAFESLSPSKHRAQAAASGMATIDGAVADTQAAMAAGAAGAAVGSGPGDAAYISLEIKGAADAADTNLQEHVGGLPSLVQKDHPTSPAGAGVGSGVGSGSGAGFGAGPGAGSRGPWYRRVASFGTVEPAERAPWWYQV